MIEKKLNKIIKENFNKLLLIESQESDSQKLAKNLYQERTGSSREESDFFIRKTLRDTITVLRDKKIGKFTLGVTRMYLDGQLNLKDNNIINDLNATLKLLLPHYNEYDKNLNNLSTQELINKFKQTRLQNVEKEKDEINNMSFGQSNYNIVPIDSFEQAKQYYSYTNPNQPWCLTHMENMFDNYTANGINQIYFCLRNGFEGIEPVVGVNAPLDDYGLSMLCIIVNENGELAYCTSRWNHENGGNDSVMNPKQISEVVGVNFYNTFKPNGKWNEILTNVQQRLANGEDPKDIFDKVKETKNGLSYVQLDNKINFLTQNNKILCDQWFDICDKFVENFAGVYLKNKGWNFINTEGKLISNQWFDIVNNFSNGFARVEKDNKWNLINTECKLISDQWFDYAGNFYHGFAKVILNGKGQNFLNTQGKLISNQWYDEVNRFYNGFARVYKKHMGNFINTKGQLITPNQWYDKMWDFYNGFADVVITGTEYMIDTKGRLYNTKGKLIRENEQYNIIQLSETQLKKIISESVKQILKIKNEKIL
jgi:hypothetical protein